MALILILHTARVFTDKKSYVMSIETQSLISERRAELCYPFHLLRQKTVPPGTGFFYSAERRTKERDERSRGRSKVIQFDFSLFHGRESWVIALTTG